MIAGRAVMTLAGLQSNQLGLAICQPHGNQIINLLMGTPRKTLHQPHIGIDGNQIDIYHRIVLVAVIAATAILDGILTVQMLVRPLIQSQISGANNELVHIVWRPDDTASAVLILGQQAPGDVHYAKANTKFIQLSRDGSIACSRS